MNEPKPTRPVLRYMGGKWRAAPKIIPYFPPHRTYVEPYGGAASVLLQKPRSYGEIYNDLDGRVVDLFRILRDPKLAKQLLHQLRLTPFAREEFEGAFGTDVGRIEAARQLVVRSFLAHGSTGLGLHKRRTGFRTDSTNAGKHQAKNWAELPDALETVTGRLRGVVIESMPALALMKRTNRPDDLIYADPPYLPATRAQRVVRGELEHSYAHDMTLADHEELLDFLTQSRAMVIVSGYHSKLYDTAFKGWGRVEFRATAQGGKSKTEVLWLNPAVENTRGLFGAAA